MTLLKGLNNLNVIEMLSYIFNIYIFKYILYMLNKVEQLIFWILMIIINNFDF